MNEIEKLRRKLARETSARVEAEELLEKKSQELYQANQGLRSLNVNLEHKIIDRTTDLRTANARTQLLHQTVLMAAEVGNLEDALLSCCQLVCELTGSPIGHIYKINADNQSQLVTSNLRFTLENDPYESFRESCSDWTFVKGEGLPGAVWEKGKTIWITDISGDNRFGESLGPLDDHLKGAFAFPVISNDQIVAVLEFFTENSTQPPVEFLHLLDTVGQQVGQVLARREALEDTRKAKEVAVEANLAKSQFLANMSHEIRTPMNAIIGMTELVLLSDITGDQRDCLETVVSSADDLLTIINEILDLSKIESKKTELDISEFDLEKLVFECVKALAPQGHDKDLDVMFSFDPSSPRRVRGDRVRLRQIIFNLIGNAIKFTHLGEVEVAVTRASQDSNECVVEFTVRDSGIGIPREKHELIFEKFEQADPTTTRNYGGTGLGLTIVSNLLKLMKGRLRLESIPGLGTSFCVSIPLPVVEEQSIQGIDDILSGNRVLLIDNTERHAEVVTAMLEPLGLFVDSTTVVSVGLEMLARNKTDDLPYDYVLVDITLDSNDPQSDIVADVRKIGGDMLEIVVLGRTSKRMMADWKKYQDNSRFILNKPFERDSLVALLYSSKKQPRTYKSETKSPRIQEDIVQDGMGEASGLNILVVEDSLINQKLAAALLNKMGHRVTLAGNGLEAVGLASSTNFDMILMDVMLPEMNGFQAAQMIRENEAGSGQRVPIIGVTAHARPGDRERCFESGMDEYVKKPIRMNVLTAVINSFSAI